MMTIIRSEADWFNGTIYLIHFDRPYKHARHYIGWTKDLEARLAIHKAGDGARLLRAVNQADIGWRVVRTWEGTRDDERRLHNQKNSPSRLCPVCKAECK